MRCADEQVEWVFDEKSKLEVIAREPTPRISDMMMR